jgi:bla regulator protein blaR1
MVPAIFSPLVIHLWQSTMFAAAAALLTLALRHNQARVRYWLWLTASCKFLLPFSLLVSFGHQFHWRTAPTVVPPRISAVTTMIVAPTFPVEPPPTIPPLHHPSFLTASMVIWAVWGCGAFVVATGWGREWLRLRGIVSAASPLHLKLPIRALATPARLEPGVIGVFRPILLLPDGIAAHLTQGQLQTIIEHELCHVRRRDNLASAIHMLVECVFWFYPMVWWLGTRLVSERERACDEAVIAAGGDRETYAEALLKVCAFYVTSPLPSVAGVSGAGLKKRIEYIMTPRMAQKLNTAKKAMLTTAATATLLVPILIGSAVATPSRAAAQSEPSKGASFQTVSIRESQPGAISHLIHVGRDSFSVQNYSLRDLIAFAYDSEGALISGPQSSLDAKYIIDAKAPGPFPAGSGYQTVDAARAMVRNLLADQFQIEIHRSTQLVSTYLLTAAGSNVLLKVANPEEPGPLESEGATSISGTGLRMGDFVELLSRRLDHPVLDQTGLAQTYDLKVDWKANGNPTAPTAQAPAPLTNPSPEVLGEALQAQLGMRLQLQQGPAEFLIVDRAEPPKNLVAALKPVAMDPALFDAHVGHYSLVGNLVMTVSRDRNHFWIQLSGQPPVEVFPEGQSKFFANVVDAQVSFEVDAQGRTTALVLHQNGHNISAPRIDDAAASQQAEALKAKVQQQVVTPGSEQALRRLISELAIGKPDYEKMSTELAQATKEQLPAIQGMLTRLGSLVSLKFTGVNAEGGDTYVAQYDHGSLKWQIGLTSDGKIASAWVGPNQ